MILERVFNETKLTQVELGLADDFYTANIEYISSLRIVWDEAFAICFPYYTEPQRRAFQITALAWYRRCYKQYVLNRYTLISELNTIQNNYADWDYIPAEVPSKLYTDETFSFHCYHHRINQEDNPCYGQVVFMGGIALCSGHMLALQEGQPYIPKERFFCKYED